MSKRRPFLLLPVSLLLLAACAHQPHHQYVGVASTTAPATNSELEWDRTGSTANGTLTLGVIVEPTTGLAVAPQGDAAGGPLPPGTYRIAITFTAEGDRNAFFEAGARFAGVVSDTGGKEVAKAAGTVTATGVELTVTAPQAAPFRISFKSTKPGKYTDSAGS